MYIYTQVRLKTCRSLALLRMCVGVHIYIHTYMYTYTQVRLKTFLSLALLCERASIIPAHATTEYLRHHAGLTLMRLADMALRSIHHHAAHP